MTTTNGFLYLNRADVEGIGLSMADVIEAVELALVEKARGRPKHWIAVSDKRFFSAMSSAVPAASAVACKWQSGSSLNPGLGLPYLTGMLILNDHETGLTLAVMDSTWLTGQRTAAASAVAARWLAGDAPRTLGIIGCGVQGRASVEAMRVVFPNIAVVRAYDIVPDVTRTYARDMEDHHGVAVTCCDDARTAVDGADIVVTSGPIEPDATRVIEAGWLKPGALGVAVDYDCYWTAGALEAADGVFTDDVAQMDHLRDYGYFLGTPPVKAEIGDVIAGTKPGRGGPDEVIVSLNMGLSVEDVITASRIYEAAKRAGTGTWLPL
jgi:ornithine cyclodeaminase/alanine dehydrogenase